MIYCGTDYFKGIEEGISNAKIDKNDPINKVGKSDIPLLNEYYPADSGYLKNEAIRTEEPERPSKVKQTNLNELQNQLNQNKGIDPAKLQENKTDKIKNNVKTNTNTKTDSKKNEKVKEEPKIAMAK